MQLRRKGSSAWATPQAAAEGQAGAGQVCPLWPEARNQRKQVAQHLEWTLPWKSALGMVIVQELC